MINRLAWIAVTIETICIILLIVLISLPKEVVQVMVGEYKIVRVED